MFGKNFIIDEDFLRKNKIPLLQTDKSWIKLFGNAKDKSIQNTKIELIELLSKEKKMEAKVRKLQKEKTDSMKMILGVSNSINNDNKLENIVLLDEYKNQLIKINEELDDLTFQLEMIPKEIREVNLKLLNATIQYGYDELKYRARVVSQADEEIRKLREQLKELISTKHDYDEWISETYTFLHGILGSEIIEKIDRERLR